MKGRYATLSHCWGLSSPLTTTLATLETRKSGIALQELPLTFQHAVIVARQLEIPFLWIDSLCIIQDSTQDWLNESVRMQEVYTNALLNISADDASDSTKGMIPRHRALVAGRLIDESGIYASRKLGRMDSSKLSHELRDSSISEDYNLTTRAWVLQERMLSPRILHFRAYELAWACDTHIKCECSTAPRRADQRTFRILHDRAGVHECDGSEDSDDVIVINGHSLPKSTIWGHLLYTYTGLALSHEADILNAIDGLASRIAQYTSKAYVAGLWIEDFPWCLLWRSAGSSSMSRRRRTENGSFPSWS